MSNDLIEALEQLISTGNGLKTRAANLYGIKNVNLDDSEYISWRQKCVYEIKKLGNSGEFLLKDIEDYPNIQFSYEDSIERVIGNLKAALDIAKTTEVNNVSREIKSLNKNVFIVHGHDELALEKVARFIERFKLNPVILKEEPNKGKTIIEKIEEHSLKVDFAVVLLTPDDIGYPRDKPEEKKQRARQNVIFETGFFIGLLKRPKVAVLYKEGVEILSNYHGVLYIPFDDAEGWRIKLAKELKEVFDFIDLNKL